MGIEEIRFQKWEDFEKHVARLDDDVKQKEKVFRNKKREFIEGVKTPFPSTPLFRGQGSEVWPLQTTLERSFLGTKIKVIDYYRLLSRVKPAIESITNKRWDLNYDNGLEESHFRKLQAYDFLVYLRQYGFPSPLLDWTKSPYVAAYFAYENAVGNSDVAVYCYIQDYYHSVRSGCVGDHEAVIGGAYVTSAARHFAQQSDYIYFLKQNKNKEWQFTSAEETLQIGNSNENDLLEKYILPVSNKKKVLKRLDLMNVNAYSLFGTEESLLKDLFLRENYL